MKDFGERFWAKVDIVAPDTCWEWRGAKMPNGYGYTYVWPYPGDRRKTGPHRVAYELMVGPIPDGLVIDHLCRNRACVNPAHLEPVTAEENTRRGEHGWRRRLTHCCWGHEFTPENTYTDKNRRRHCRTCDRLKMRTRRAVNRKPQPASTTTYRALKPATKKDLENA